MQTQSKVGVLRHSVSNVMLGMSYAAKDLQLPLEGACQVRKEGEEPNENRGETCHRETHSNSTEAEQTDNFFQLVHLGWLNKF